ncbi:hypothetical protein Gotur_034105 [Gossypium turneri]
MFQMLLEILAPVGPFVSICIRIPIHGSLGTFACIVLFGLCTGTDNIRDYAGLYTKDPLLALSLALCLLSLGGLPPLPGFSKNSIYSGVDGRQASISWFQ